MATKSSSNRVYVVLNVTQGFHFDCWRTIRLRIGPSLEGKILLSDYVLPISDPIFNMYFVWSVTEPHLKLLQCLKPDILIGIVAEQSGNTWSTGCTKLGIQHAQLLTPHIELYSRRLRIKIIKAPGGAGLQPELAVTLTIQSELPQDKHAQIHVAYLKEPPEAGQPCSNTSLTGSILKSDATPSTSDAKPSTSDATPSTSDATPSTSDATPSTSKNVKPKERKKSNSSETSTYKPTKNVRFQDEL